MDTKDRKILLIVVLAVGGVLALGALGFVGLIVAYAMMHSPPHSSEDSGPSIVVEIHDASASSDSSVQAQADDASAPAPETHDFEDMFEYGGSGYSRSYDAGSAEPSALTAKPGYDRYVNPRFGFAVDVPKSLVAMPPPDNGDGQQYRLGGLVVMTASGMHAIEELSIHELCASSPNVSARKETKTSCWATGKRDGTIYWERVVIAHEVIYSLRFQYVESLKTEMDPVVTHVNESWSY